MVRACSRRAAHPNKIGQTMVQFWVCGKWLVKAWSAVGDKIPADEPRAQVVLHLCARAPFAQLRLSSKGALVYASVKYILTQMVYSSWAIESLLDLPCSSFAQRWQKKGESDAVFVFNFGSIAMFTAKSPCLFFYLSFRTTSQRRHVEIRLGAQRRHHIEKRFGLLTGCERFCPSHL